MPGRIDVGWLESPAQVAVNALAAFSLTRVWIKGGFPPIEPVRRMVGAALARYEENHDGRQHPLQPLTDCPWCAGFWVGAGVVVAASLPTRRAWAPVAAALAFSAVAGLASGGE